MRDFKKCGITFPRPLIEATAEVLMEKYPNSRFELLKAYLDPIYTLEDGTPYPTKRGFFLGMANALVTLV